MSLSTPSQPQHQSTTNTTNTDIQEIDVFSRFDVASDFSDHHYANLNSFTNSSRTVHKKIMKEWKILQDNLPDTIFVRVYENRIDLMRAAIVGAAGTPYHDGLYFFDIAFPSDYPTRPPSVHYRSYGLRINPNLYARGRVCLSLLNTWYGKKGEKWNPNESTVLQVLVSIQALVLNEKPYFNEPGHDIWPSRVILERKSNAYNEDVFVLCCKTMLYTLRRPPKNFESLVTKHVKERGRVILAACVAYVENRARVGYHRCDLSSSGDVSGRFQRSITQLLPQLVAAFTRNGASLETFMEQLKTVACESKTHVVVKKKKNGWVAMRLFGKLKKILGLKKKE